jgi:hypothetical protein
MGKSVVLWQIRDQLGARNLWASLTPNGDVQIEGQDLGDGVENFWGKSYTEYEYAMTIQATDVPALLDALGSETDVLSALQKHFENSNTSDPKSFLEEHGVPYEFWSRIGE